METTVVRATSKTMSLAAPHFAIRCTLSFVMVYVRSTDAQSQAALNILWEGRKNLARRPTITKRDPITLVFEAEGRASNSQKERAK